MEDRQIIALLWERAETALTATASKYEPSLRVLAMNILSDPQDVQECINDTYLAVWNTIPPKKPENLGGYIHRIAKNQALKKLRSRQAQKRSCRYTVALEELAETLSGGTMEEKTDAKELGNAINRYLQTLSRENRVLFLRRYWYGDGIEELSVQLGMKPGAVSVRLSRLREKLRKHLLKEGFWL